MKRSLLAFVPILLLTSCEHSRAQLPVPPPPSSTPDPPGRVARLSYKVGPVSLKPAGTDSWVAAELNRPLTTGDQVWTDGNARAELDLGHAFVRLDSQSSLSILNLDDRGVQISLTEGTAQVRLRRLDEDDEFEVDTPQAAFTLLRTGDYRFAAQNSGAETTTTVRAGQVEVAAPGQTFSIRAQQRARITGVETVSYEISPTPPLDGFDDFCQTRDRREQRAEALKNVSPHVIGWEDLDEHGSWRAYPVWGPVWFPRTVAVGWVPYRFGHWVWIAPWGWTWIDDSPWGFAPFHYGRWVFVDGFWGWVPGPVRTRAVYAPALVVFAGGGPGFRYYFGIGAGLGVAWFPLGPREVYIPPYRTSRVYVTNINISHTVVTNPANIWRTDVARQRYVNRNVAGSFTAVPEDVFVRGRAVSPAAVRVSPAEARTARVGGSSPPVAPDRRSLTSEPVPTAPQPPDGVSRRQTTVRRTPAPEPVPFERQRPTLERDPGRPPDPGRIEELRPTGAQPTPPRRQIERAQPTAPLPPPVQQPAPRRTEPAPVPSPRSTENRRRTIEQERQRVESRSEPSRERAPSGRRR